MYLVREELHTMFNTEELSDAILLVLSNNRNGKHCISCKEIHEFLGLHTLKLRKRRCQAFNDHEKEYFDKAFRWIIK